MNTDNLNIMNLLLGSLPQTADLSLLGGSKPTGEIQNTGFDLIFDQLLMPLGGMETANADNEAGSLNADNEAGSFSLIDQTSDELLLDSDNKLKSILSEKTMITNPYVINDKEIPFVSEESSIIENNIISSLPIDAINNKAIINNLENIPLVDISGKFEVQSWSVDGDNVNLELVSEKTPESVIKISLPSEKIIEQFVSKNLISSSALNRTPLDGQSTVSSTQLEVLLGKYDIKELQISTTEDKSVPVSSKNIVDVEIFAQNAGQEIVLKSKLNQNAIQIKKESLDLKSLALNNKSEKVSFESGESKFSSVKQSLQDSIINLPAKSTDADKIDFMKQFTEFGTQKNLKTDEANQLPNFIKSPTEMVLTKDKVDLQPVRFTLPDNINAQLKLNGKSVRINIEPNQLGPARLSLNMQNDKLSAVVTVHSAQAKMTVEGSLDRLLDALNKANIKVDYIDVNVNQENSYEQFAQSKSGYYRQQSNNNYSLSEYLLNENNIIENITPRGVSYVNANGVNLTA